MMAQVGRDGESRPAARMAFQQDENGRDGNQCQRDLRGTFAISHAVPGSIDRRREGVNAVVLDGPEIGECFKQGECRACCDSRAGERQRSIARAS